MENENITRAALIAGIEPGDAGKIVKALNATVRQALVDNDSVAIPGFGSFNTVKEDERIVSDHASGHTLLTPPTVEITFTPALKLIKGVKTAHRL